MIIDRVFVLKVVYKQIFINRLVGSP